ncbi:MAG: hypothetical protein GXN95_05695 [Methanococci archaeon]|nr:hypothetical protein [Methanococci archaeon]
MRKLLIAILGLAIIGAVFAFPPWMEQQTQSYEPINPEEILKNAEIIEHTTPFGYEIKQLEVDGRIVGVLWDNVDLDKVEVGKPFETPFGEKYPLYYNGELVGFIFTNHPTPHYCGCGMCWQCQQ